jgi:hypothetical protein
MSKLARKETRMGSVTNINDSFANVRRWIREGTPFTRGKLFARSVGLDEVVDPGTLREHWGRVLQSVPVDYLVTWDGLPIAWHWVETYTGTGKLPQPFDRWAVPGVAPGDVPGEVIQAIDDALLFATPIRRLDDYRLR